MLFTRQTVFAPGFVSSSSQLPTLIPVMSSGTMLAVESRSFRSRLMDAIGTRRPFVRLCAFSRIIFYLYLPMVATVRAPARSELMVTVFGPGST